MRFIAAWSSIASQNVALKLATICLSVAVISLSFATAKLSLKAPILIERSCFTKSIEPVDVKHSPQEIEAFVKEALKQRFDSDADFKPGFAAGEEERLRMQEQQDLKKRGMTQKVIVNGVKINSTDVIVDIDRLISVGRIRSAFSTQLNINLARVSRSEGNPYGLLLSKVSPIAVAAAAEGASK